MDSQYRLREQVGQRGYFDPAAYAAGTDFTKPADSAKGKAGNARL